MKEFKNDLKGFPVEIVEKMLERQVEQGNKRDVSVFERDRTSWKLIGGFAWKDTKEGFHFWNTVITYKKFDHFFKKYTKSARVRSADIMHFLDLYKSRRPVYNREFMDNAKFIVTCDPYHETVSKAKIIYAEGKEVVFDVKDINIENGMLIIKAK